MENSNIVENKNNYLNFLSKKHLKYSISILSAILLLNNPAFAKEQDEEAKTLEATSKSKSVTSSQENYVDDHRNPIHQMFQEMDKFYARSLFKNLDNFDDILFNNRMHTNLATYDKQYILNIDYPGFDKKELGIEIRGDYLIINGKKIVEEKTDKEKSFSNQEYRNSFQHRLLIPKDVDPNSITSSLKNGVLTIILPRSIDKKIESKQIPIN